MALRIPWDIEEAVLMLDMLLKSIDGKLTRKEAIRQVSEKLRRRAVNERANPPAMLGRIV